MLTDSLSIIPFSAARPHLRRGELLLAAVLEHGGLPAVVVRLPWRGELLLDAVLVRVKLPLVAVVMRSLRRGELLARRALAGA